jgi:hypothetical protein
MFDIEHHLMQGIPMLVGSVFEDSNRLSWLEFVVTGLIYTGVVFRDERSKKGPHILSKENSRPLSVITGAHLAFLTIFFVLAEISISNGSWFPSWLVSAKHRDTAVILELFLMAEVLSSIERSWLYRAARSDVEIVRQPLAQDDSS